MKDTQGIKAQVMKHYGNGYAMCVRCGWDDMRALSIDHIQGGGNKQRTELKLRSSHSFYSWLIKNEFPEGYQTLCMNCQFIKRFENHENDRTLYTPEERLKRRIDKIEESRLKVISPKTIIKFIDKQKLGKFTSKDLKEQLDLPEDKYPHLRMTLSRLVASGKLDRLYDGGFQRVGDEVKWY